MVDSPAMSTPRNFSDGPETVPADPLEEALDQRIYRTLARNCILDHKKRTARTKRATSISVTLISAASFMALMAIGYLAAR